MSARFWRRKLMTAGVGQCVCVCAVQAWNVTEEATCAFAKRYGSGGQSKLPGRVTYQTLLVTSATRIAGKCSLSQHADP